MELLNNIQQVLVAKKNQFNKFGNYKYRSAEDILEAVKPLLGKGILTIADDIMFIGERYYVKATITLKSEGEEVTVSAYAREPLARKGMDESQITGAASSYARKYALNGLFCIDDMKDSDSDKEPLVPKEPTKAEQKIVEMICLILEKQTKKIVSRKKVGGFFLMEQGAYPSKANKTAVAAKWIINLNRESEWAEEITNAQLMETIEQAFFDFETQHQDWLADHDGKLVFDKDKFIKAITKHFKGLPISKSSKEIAEAVKPEDVAIAPKEGEE